MTTPVVVPTGFHVGEWEVTELIGSGGWSSVYGARRIESAGEEPAEAALKFLPSDDVTPARMAQLEEMAERELRLGSSGQPGLVRVLETLVAEADEAPLDGARVLVMERADTSLRDLIAADGAGSRPDHAAAVLADLWQILCALHERGWVHGDVKPANVLLLGDGAVRLGDFGLSAELEGTHAYTERAASFDYAPPEWWTERTSDQGTRVRPARDLWAFGVLIHVTLSGGAFPFDGQAARSRALSAQAYATGNAPLRLDPGIAPGWRQVIERLLDPDERTREAGRDDITALIEAAETGLPVRRTRRRPPVRWVAAAVALVVVAGGGVGLAVGGDDDRNASAARPIGGELRAGAAVPAAYRDEIEKAAGICQSSEVTPALVAGVLKAESNFDPRLRDRRRDEYGIARWTPSVFKGWRIDVDGGGASVFSAPDSIRSLGSYLCAIGRRVKSARGDGALLRAAAFRVGSKQVGRAGGIPPAARGYISRVERSTRSFAASE